MKIQFWGVRGSIPAPGPETNRYGGNTTCVAVTSASGHLFILDMGTGLANLGNTLMKGPFGNGTGAATILLTHAHWDHIQGFPFFPPIYVGGNRFDVFGNALSPSALESMLEGQMNPHYSPIQTLKNVGADFSFDTMAIDQTVDIHGVSVRAVANPHGRTTALAFRLEENGRSMVFAPDVGYQAGRIPDASLALYRGVDVLIHDSTYTPEDQSSRQGRGQSSLAEAVRAARKAEVKKLVLFHYDQDYSDDQVDDLLARARERLVKRGVENIEVIASAEGLIIEL